MEPFVRQLKRSALLGLIGLCTVLVIDSISPAHRFHEAHLLPVDLSVFLVAALLSLWFVPIRVRKPER